MDGAEVNDPGSDTFFGTGKPTSGIEIPEKGVDFYHAKECAARRGPVAVVRVEETDQTRRVLVYTPPGYDADTRSGTRCCTCNTGAARTRPAGSGRAT